MPTSADVAAALGQTCDAPIDIAGVSTWRDPRPHTLAFVTHWSEDHYKVLDANPDTVFLVPVQAGSVGDNAFVVDKPRLAYALVMRDVLDEAAINGISSTAVVDGSARIGSRVSIGHFVVVEPGVVLGDDVRIDHHVVLKGGVQIGDRSRIGSHTSIGGPGFGFEIDDNGEPVRMAHRGGVVIGSDVEIGQQCSIAQGTIEPTRISDHVKIDDCVFIAHNVSIGRASYVIAGAEISGSVVIGERVWISPEATIINKVQIGDDALVGIGSVVLKDVEAGQIVAGVPAKSRGRRH